MDLTDAIFEALYLDATGDDTCNFTKRDEMIKLLKFCREKGLNNTCIKLGQILLAVAEIRVPLYPEQSFDNLTPVTREFILRILQEVSICMYYVKEIGQGALISDLLLFTKTEEMERAKINKAMIHMNSLFYAQQLEYIEKFKLEPEMPIVDGNESERYRCMNPFILDRPGSDDYIIVVRGVNYDQVNAKDFYSKSPDGKVRTRNIICRYDSQFNLLNKREIIDTSDRKKYPMHVLGLEDVHLFRHSNEDNDEIWFSCTTLDSKKDFIPVITLCKLKDYDETDVETDEPVELDFAVPIFTSDYNRPEKNWMPYSKDGIIRFVYSHDPLTIVTAFMEDDDNGNQVPTGNSNKTTVLPTEYDFTRFRGSAGPLEYPSVIGSNIVTGYLFIIHEVIMNTTRHYVHRFVWTNDQFEAIKVSPTFYFDHIGIEFCKSMCHGIGGYEAEDLLLGVGLEDREAWIYQISKVTVDHMLNVIPNV
jgi:hypothetical protein